MCVLLYKENWHNYSSLVLTVQMSFLTSFMLLNILGIFKKTKFKLDHPCFSPRAAVFNEDDTTYLSFEEHSLNLILENIHGFYLRL